MLRSTTIAIQISGWWRPAYAAAELGALFGMKVSVGQSQFLALCIAFGLTGCPKFRARQHTLCRWKIHMRFQPVARQLLEAGKGEKNENVNFIVISSCVLSAHFFGQRLCSLCMMQCKQPACCSWWV